MSGLLRKDLELMSLNKRFILMIVIISLFITGTGTDATFIQTYLAFMALFMVLNSISYDEMDNGMAYLMVLPVSRKTYVKEKYFLVAITTGVVAVAGSVLAVLVNWMKDSPVTMEVIGISFLVSILASGIFSAILIPIVLKYGPDKGRIVIGIVCAGIFGGVMLLDKCKDMLKAGGILKGIDISVTRYLEELGFLSLAGITILITILVLWISGSISIRVMEQKEF